MMLVRLFKRNTHVLNPCYHPPYLVGLLRISSCKLDSLSTVSVALREYVLAVHLVEKVEGSYGAAPRGWQFYFTFCGSPDLFAFMRQKPLFFMQQNSVTFLAGAMAKFATHMGDPHGDPQTSPQHADPHGLGAFLKKTIEDIDVDRRVVGWSAGRHVDHPCGWQISPWPL